MDQDQQPQCNAQPALPAVLPDNPQSVDPSLPPPQCVSPQANGTTPQGAQPFVGQYDGPKPEDAPEDEYGRNGGAALLKIGAGRVPFLGPFLDGTETGEALHEGNYGEAAMHTAAAAIEPLGMVVDMAEFFTSDMQDHSINPDTGLTKQQEHWMYEHGAQSRPGQP
jgi:hypothetical protein